MYPIGRPVRVTITLYPIGRPVRATITLYPIGRPVRATITLYPIELLLHCYHTCYRQEGSPLHSDENTHGVKVTRQLVTMDTDDESSVSLSPSGGGGGYIPSTLEQHSHRRTTPTSHIIDLKKLGKNITILSNNAINSILSNNAINSILSNNAINNILFIGILGGSEEELDELPIAAATSDTAQSNQLDEFDFYN